MANQFSVMPAGDMTQGLQGLGLALQYASEKKQEQRLAEQKRAADAEAQAALYDALKSDNPEMVMEAATKYPSISKQLSELYGLKEDFQKKEASEFAAEVLANPERAGEIAERRIALLEMQGRDPQHTLDFYNTYLQDPKEALRAIETVWSGTDPEGYKSYRSSLPEAAEGFTLGANDIRFDAAGNVVARGITLPENVPAGYELIPAAEAAAMGLPPTSSYQRNKETGQISGVGGAQTVVNNNMGQATEGERTAGILANRLDFAQSQIDEILAQSPEAQSPGALPTMLEGAGMNYLARVSNPAERQIIEAAQDDMLDAALTLGTGAAYTAEQLKGYRRSYFPQLGDDQKTIEAKGQRLKNLLDAAYTKAGRGAPAARRSGQGGEIVAVNSQADFDALPSGAIYLEDGVQYRKP